MTQPNTVFLPIEPSSFRNIISETVAEILARLPANDDTREQYLYTEQDAAKRLSMSYDKLKELRLAGVDVVSLFVSSFVSE